MRSLAMQRPGAAAAALLLFAAAAPRCCSAALPPRAEVLADGMRAADYWFNRSSGMPDCGWESATLMIGVSDLQAASSSPSLLQRMAAWGGAHGWAFCGGPSRALNPDFQACGATYAAAYAALPPPRNDSWLAAARQQYEAEMASGAGGVRPSHWSWIDAVFMAAQVGATRGTGGRWQQARVQGGGHASRGAAGVGWRRVGGRTGGLSPQQNCGHANAHTAPSAAPHSPLQSPGLCPAGQRDRRPALL